MKKNMKLTRAAFPAFMIDIGIYSLMALVLLFAGCGKAPEEAGAVSTTNAAIVTAPTQLKPRYELIEAEGQFAVRDNAIDWISHPFNSCADAKKLLNLFTVPLLDSGDSKEFAAIMAERRKHNWKPANCPE